MKAINQNNYLEYILLAVDNELSPAQLRDLQIFLSTHQEAQLQYDVLMQTKVPLTTPASFAGKLNLLAIANTNKVQPVNRSKYLLLIAASVACLLFGSLMYKTLFQNSSTDSLIVRGEKDEIKEQINTMPIDTLPTTPIYKSAPETQLAQATPRRIKTVTKRISKSDKPAQKLKTVHQVSTPKNIGGELEVVNQALAIEMETLTSSNRFISNKEIIMMNNKAENINDSKIINTDILKTKEESKYLANHRVYKVYKKINQEIASLTDEMKHVKDEGVAIEINLPKFLNKKIN